VLLLLEADIDVYTTMNIQHLESLNDQVYQFTGVRVRETVPDWVIRRADEVVMVDLTPGALRNRLARGAVYAPDKAAQALEQFFKEPTLAALRELALRQTAREVDARQPSGLEPPMELTHSAEQQVGTSERVLILVTDDPATAGVIRRGRRVADYLKVECYAVAVSPTGDLQQLPPDEREAVERHLNFARNLGVDTHVVAGERPEDAVVDFARRNGVSQILVARPRAVRPRFGLGRPELVLRLIERARDFQVTVVAHRQPQQL
jgi:two-component system sensor histidine kinase KdpD